MVRGTVAALGFFALCGVGCRGFRGFILIGIATLLLVAHGCHGDDVDHELGVPVPLQSQPQESPPCPD